jgi:hypothetical protein
MEFDLISTTSKQSNHSYVKGRHANTKVSVSNSNAKI